MNTETIMVNVSPAGSVKIEASGFRGQSCEKATQQLEVVLGGGVKRTRKPEYSLPPTNTAQSIKRTF